MLVGYCSKSAVYYSVLYSLLKCYFNYRISSMVVFCIDNLHGNLIIKEIN